MLACAGLNFFSKTYFYSFLFGKEVLASICQWEWLLYHFGSVYSNPSKILSGPKIKFKWTNLKKKTKLKKSKTRHKGKTLIVSSIGCLLKFSNRRTRNIWKMLMFIRRNLQKFVSVHASLKFCTFNRCQWYSSSYYVVTWKIFVI